MAKTEILRTTGLQVLKGLSKTTTAVTAKKCHVFNTDGWAIAGADAPGPHGYPVKTVAAPASGQSDVEMIVAGFVKVGKATGAALNQGVYVKSDTNGDMVLWAITDEAEEIVGMVTETAASAADEVEIMLRP